MAEIIQLKADVASLKRIKDDLTDALLRENKIESKECDDETLISILNDLSLKPQNQQ